MGHLEPSCPTMKSIVFFAVIAAAFAEPEPEPKADPEADPYLLYGGYYPYAYGHVGYYGYPYVTMARDLLSQLLNQKLIQRLIPTCCTEDTMDILMLMDTMDILMCTESNLKYLLPIFR